MIPYKEGEHAGVVAAVIPWAFERRCSAQRVVATSVPRCIGQRFSVIVLSNAANFNPAAAAKRIASVYLGDKLDSDLGAPIDNRGAARNYRLYI